MFQPLDPNKRMYKTKFGYYLHDESYTPILCGCVVCHMTITVRDEENHQARCPGRPVC